MTSASNHSSQLFYRGDLDDQVVKVSNGAMVNRDYAAFMENGAWSQVKTWQINDRVHTITGYGLPNYSFVEGDTGLILFDTGINKGMGLELIEKKASFSNKPIVAIIYSHHHYTGGAGGVLSAYPDKNIPIYGHPKLDENLINSFLVLGEAQRRRGPMQMGHYLPDSGPDAFHAIEEPHFEQSELNTHAHVAVSNPVSHGEKILIDGLEFIFYHAVADTDDSLIVHVPEFDLVMHNAAVMPFLFPLYTLRGDFYRSIPDMLEGIDLMRKIRPQNLIGCHGLPVSDPDDIYEMLTTHRDAFAFLYQQTVQGINAGKTPDQLAAEVRLPQHWADYPGLFPAYVDVEHIVRGIYRGLIGWWSEDTADLYPPAKEELDTVIVEGFGGSGAVIKRAQQAFEEKKYNLTAKLMSLVLTADPDNQVARQLKADALRQMAQTTPTGVQSRSYLLTEALHLEGELNRYAPAQGGRGFPPPNIESLMSMPIEAFIRLLEYRLDADKSQNLDVEVRLNFKDRGRTYGIAVRRGAVEFLEHSTVNAALDLELTYRKWIEIILCMTSLSDAIEQGQVKVQGNRAQLEDFLNAYQGVL